ncbi:MAG: phosphoribosylanthranilate isomerase [Candidatus Marinimicrobia bacterium]|nr:phosphoribosylanthranilate isomerase [Candidatus Neomarinimicrobiota bacterium]
MKPRIKICCIKSIAEAETAIRYGATAIGLVSEMPSGPGVISEELIREIALKTPPGIGTFLLTSKQDTASIIEQQRRCQVNTIQLCDILVEGSYDDFRKASPGINIVQVIHVVDDFSVEQAVSIAPLVDGLLLDSGIVNSSVKELGGTGRTHNWELSKTIVELTQTAVWLAGGLNSENVSSAIGAVSPFGVDVCSGVRSSGSLDESKLSQFVKKINGLKNH